MKKHVDLNRTWKKEQGKISVYVGNQFMIKSKVLNFTEKPA